MYGSHLFYSAFDLYCNCVFSCWQCASAVCGSDDGGDDGDGDVLTPTKYSIVFKRSHVDSIGPTWIIKNERVGFVSGSLKLVFLLVLYVMFIVVFKCVARAFMEYAL